MIKVRNFQFVLLFILLSAVSNKAAVLYGILSGETPTEQEDFCIVYFDEFSRLASEKSKAVPRILDNATNINFCENETQSDFTNNILLLTKHNCSIPFQAHNVQQEGGKGLLFLTPSGKIPDHHIDPSRTKNISIPVGLISETSATRLMEMGPLLRVRLYAPTAFNFDYSLLIIWIIAVFTVGAGSYWSGHIRFAIYSKEISVIAENNGGEAENTPHVKSNSSEDSSINVGVRYVAILVVCMGAMLILLYFFFKYLVYVIIGLFVLASILSVYSCLLPLVMKIPSNWCLLPDFHCGSVSCNIDFRQVVLTAFACAVSITWVIIRKHNYAWILQDILGVFFCVHMLKSIRLPNLKICFALLILLFFYDIFFVFVTPLLTVGGESVMEEVATGGNSDESLPMVLKVSHLGFDELSICRQQFSILGFGDILVPGLLISYCEGFDLISKHFNFYFPVTLVAYGIGLITTFVGLFAMNTAQPALLYLVPCTLIPPIVLGWCKGDLGLLWSGFKVIKPEVSTVIESQAVPEITSETINTAAVSAENVSNKRNEEKKQLLR